jgi:NAD(P)-dependent dehydrogenase (short-subunit alcohol dehydrogenase family)
LALVDRGEQRLRQAFPDLVGSPDYLLVNCADLMDEGAVEASVSEAILHFSRIDVLVNTVGGFRAGKMLHETPLETWDFLLNLNARSVFIACRKVIPHMLNQGSGKIVNVAARPGLKGQAGMAAYSASKSAVIRLTESMAAELKDKGINVNCIIPGTIDTPQNREALPDADYSTWVAPESLADVILFLTSDAARDVHGAALPVHGRS